MSSTAHCHSLPTQNKLRPMNKDINRAEESDYSRLVSLAPSLSHRHVLVATGTRRSFETTLEGPQAFVYMYTWALKDLYMEAGI